jgi:hypothetical protein
MESPEQPTLLMHYTNAEGLEGILKSKTLRLTHHNCTNDSMETIYTFNALKNLLKNNFEDIPTIFGELSEYISQQLPQNISKHLLENSDDYIKSIGRILSDDETLRKLKPHLGSANIYSFFSRFLVWFDYLRDNEGIHWYTFSLSRIDHGKNYGFFAQNGRLSQWRAYGNYALVFRKDLLEKALKDKHEKDDVSYVPESVKYPGPDLKEISDDFKRFFKAQYLINVPDDEQKLQNKAIFGIILIAFVKHLGFEEENEERLWGMHINDKYLETNVSGKKYNTCMNFEELPIEKIIIGPCKSQQEQEDKEKHLKTWLEDNGYPNIAIGRSDIPYVGQYR